MRITHYDIYDNGKGSNLIRYRPYVAKVQNIETFRAKLQARLQRRMRTPEGRRYKEITVCLHYDDRD